MRFILLTSVWALPKDAFLGFENEVCILINHGLKKIEQF
jgi:hypothetical protein